MAAIDKLSVINKSLSRMGASPIGALDEATAKARKCVAIYDDLIPACLGLYDWSFNRVAYPLNRLDETPINGWKYAYAMPGNAVGVPVKVLTSQQRPDDPLREFELQGGKLYANRLPLWAIFPVDVNPGLWRPSFRLAVTVGLAGDLCVPIAHDKTLGEILKAEAFGAPELQMRGGLMGIALSQDASSSNKNAPLWRDPLTEARLM